MFIYDDWRFAIKRSILQSCVTMGCMCGDAGNVTELWVGFRETNTFPLCFLFLQLTLLGNVVLVRGGGCFLLTRNQDW